MSEAVEAWLFEVLFCTLIMYPHGDVSNGGVGTMIRLM